MKSYSSRKKTNNAAESAPAREQASSSVPNSVYADILTGRSNSVYADILTGRSNSAYADVLTGRSNPVYADVLAGRSNPAYADVLAGRSNSAYADVLAGRSHASSAMMGHRQDLAPSLAAKMSKAFGMDLSNVKLYRSQAMAQTGARGMASGNKIVLSKDIDLNTMAGQAVLGHELSHVHAQSQGIGMGHSGLYENAALEHRADTEGWMAARGQSILGGDNGMETGPGMSGIAGLTPIGAGMSASAGAPMQASLKKKKPNTSNADEKYYPVPKSDEDREVDEEDEALKEAAKAAKKAPKPAAQAVRQPVKNVKKEQVPFDPNTVFKIAPQKPSEMPLPDFSNDEERTNANLSWQEVVNGAGLREGEDDLSYGEWYKNRMDQWISENKNNYDPNRNLGYNYQDAKRIQHYQNNIAAFREESDKQKADTQYLQAVKAKHPESSKKMRRGGVSIGGADVNRVYGELMTGAGSSAEEDEKVKLVEDAYFGNEDEKKAARKKLKEINYQELLRKEKKFGNLLDQMDFYDLLENQGRDGFLNDALGGQQMSDANYIDADKYKDKPRPEDVPELDDPEDEKHYNELDNYFSTFRALSIVVGQSIVSAGSPEQKREVISELVEKLRSQRGAIKAGPKFSEEQQKAYDEYLKNKK